MRNYIKDDEVIVSEFLYREIVEIMFQGESYNNIEKIHVNVENTRDIKRVSNILSSNNYNVTHAFEYYE